MFELKGIGPQCHDDKANLQSCDWTHYQISGLSGTTVQCPSRSGMWPSVYSPERHTSLASPAQECWWSNLINNNSYFTSSGPHSLLQDIWSALMTPPRCLKSTPQYLTSVQGPTCQLLSLQGAHLGPSPEPAVFSPHEDPGENLTTGETHHEWPASGIHLQPLSHQPWRRSMPSSTPELLTPLLIPSMTPKWLFIHHSSSPSW